MLLAFLFAQAEPLVPVATGAKVNEAAVRATIYVPSATHKTIQKGIQAAQRSLTKGIATRIVISPGVYRESAASIDWQQGKSANTALVIEGRGQVVWTGADVFPLSKWKREGSMYKHPWPHQWGNFAYSWSAKGLVAHRSEMLFINGRPLTQRILERYKIGGIVQDPDNAGKVSYQFTGARSPSEVLKPGEFGVIERPGPSKGIYFCPLDGQVLKDNSIEISVRRNLLDLRGKSKVVLRNITFTHTANDDGDFGANNAVRFAIAGKARSNDVLIDRCKILWSAQTGLHIDGNRWTIRDSEFSFNGGSGLASGKSKDILWERNKTNFNVWRLWRGGELGYYTGGFKMHETSMHTVSGHQAIGNCTMGAWWDVHCRDVTIENAVLVGNAANLQFELCEGPFYANRLVVAGGRAHDGQLRLWEHGNTWLTNSIVYSDYAGNGSTGLYNLRWFGRNDVHSKMAKIAAGVNVTKSNVFAAGPNVPNFGLIDDIRGSEWYSREPMTYRGSDNIFWSSTGPSFKSKWIKDEGRTGELALRAIPVNDWMVPKTYSEKNPRHLDPRFIDPSRHDYRFSNSSPLYKYRGDYLQFRLNDETRRQWEWFVKWSSYQPDRWNEPPIE
ncbi:MAG: right-handed parallel beta-helix repeat-containing protein [Chlorobia bacterium]|nr:right-handed parallel beta-helix repeat-containing protein [Fimbriimonadaceae bacterium]